MNVGIQLKFDQPAGWTTGESVDAWCILQGPESTNGFRSNIVVTADRLPANSDLLQIAESISNALNEQHGAFAVRRKRATDDAMDRVVEFDTNLGRVVQYQRYVVARGQGCDWFVQVQATSALDREDQDSGALLLPIETLAVLAGISSEP